MTGPSHRPTDRAARPGPVFAGHRLFDGLSVAAVADLSAIISAEGGMDRAAIARRFPRLGVSCLEDLDEIREQWTSAHLDRVIDTFFDAHPGGHDAQLLPYAGCPAADRRGDGSLSVSAVLRRHLDDKRRAKEIFARAGITTIKGAEAMVNRDSLAAAAEQFGYPYVARAPFASSGLGTFLVRDAGDAELLLGQPQTDGPWLFEEYAGGGYSLNTTGVVGPQRTTVYAPSVQILGEPECSDLPFGFCGNDFPTAAALPERVRQEVAAQTRTLGDHLRELGYRGVFGLDFVIDGRGRVLPCEINPRFQNSTALLNFGLADTPGVTPAVAHLRTFAGAADEIGPEPVPGPALSQILVHSSFRAPEQISGNGVQPGQYRRRGDEYEYVGDTFDPRELAADGLLIVGAVAHAGMHIKAGAALARLVVRGPVLDAESLRLTPAAVTAIQWLRARVGLRDVQPMSGVT